MVNFIYNSLISLAIVVLKLLSLFNEKLKKGVIGRKQSFAVLENGISKTDKTIWFHCASLGEYEQGLPVFEAIKKEHPNHKIVLTFFSPSGYDVRKNSPIADIVTYLPLDSKSNAKQFVRLLKPELSVFVKYDIWPNYLQVLKQYDLTTILISAAFRPEQHYFKWYGSLFQKALKTFHHIFTQNQDSISLLNNIGYTSCSFSGDTRYDRVNNQLKTDNTLQFLEEFKKDKLLIMFGSSWQEDEKLYIDYINNTNANVKFLIAPHEINTEKINRLKDSLIKPSILYSELEKNNPSKSNIFILNTIGLLSKAYSYADIAYVGGAAGETGLHNILEPATFGIPVLFGNNHKKFPEAQQLINAKGAFDISNTTDFTTRIELFVSNTELRIATGKEAAKFVTDQTGATEKIISYLNSQV